MTDTENATEMKHFSNCPHCGSATSDGYVNCFDCGEIFAMNPVDLIKGKIKNLEAGVDYSTTQELDKTVNELSSKFSKDEVGVMTWNDGVVVFDGSKTELILNRYKSNKNILKLAAEGDRWAATLNEFRSLRTDLQTLNVRELDLVQQNFNHLKGNDRLSSEAQSFLSKPKFSNFVALADNKPYSGLPSLLDTIKDVRSCIEK